MKDLVVALAGLILLAWWIEVYRLSRAHNRRERDRERERDNLRHITGKRPWWKEPPGDGPEEDH
jgi:hypothetical protein